MAMNSSSLEMYTNKDFLVRDHERWIQKLSNSINIAIDRGNVRFEDNSKQITSVNPADRVNISILKKSVNQTLFGKYFLCRNITAPYCTASLETVVEDPEGENAVRLSLYNFTRPRRSEDLKKVIPIGSLLVIRHPFFKKAMCDEGFNLRCDDPANVLFIEDRIVGKLFPMLPWNRKKPALKDSGVPEKVTGFAPGDVIQDWSDPFVKILLDNQKGGRCDHCFKGNRKLLVCKNCKLMFYCNKSCQLKDWKKGHKFECKSEYFKKPIDNPLQPSDFKRQLLRLFGLLKLHPDRGQKKYRLYDGTERSFEDLVSHQSKLEKDFRFLLFCKQMAKELEAEGNLVNSEDGVKYLLRLAGIWKTNAFPILNEEESESIGSAIFIEPSVFDHSCKPNAFFNLQGCRIQIRAIGHIPEGEKPHVTYIVGHKTKQERLAVLKERYNFLCKCKRCKLEETGNLVDYNRLKNLLSAQNYNWKEYIKTHNEIMEMMGKLYNEYDERITNRRFLAFQEAKLIGAPKDVLRKLSEKAKDHILVTFGAKSADYQKYMTLI